MPKVLVSGVSGFAGKHLTRELVSRKCEVVGVGLAGSADKEIETLLSSYHICDLTDEKQVMQLPLQNVDTIINLAGLASISASFDDPEVYARINVSVLTNLARQLQTQNPKARLLAVSTGAVYDSRQHMPLTEGSRLTDQGAPYVISKILMEKEARNFQEKGLQVVIVRPFNHIGPGQAPGFLVPDLYQKLLSAKTSGEPVKMGNLEAKRDFTDVRDIAKAYTDLALSETLAYGTYNLCSGTSRSVQAVLDLMIREMGLEGQVETELDESLTRPNDPPELYGNYQRIHEETGWKPTIPFEQTISDFVAWKKQG